MNKATLTDTALIIEPLELDKLWAVRFRLTVPLHHIVNVALEPVETLKSKRGMRMLGLATFHKWAGTFILRGEKSFWNVSDAGSVVSVELRDEKYKRLYVSVKNPQSVIDEIKAATASFAR